MQRSSESNLPPSDDTKLDEAIARSQAQHKENVTPPDSEKQEDWAKGEGAVGEVMDEGHITGVRHGSKESNDTEDTADDIV